MFVRRTVMAGFWATIGALLTGGRSEAGSPLPALTDRFPYPIVSVPARTLYATWQALNARASVAVVVGDDESLARMAEAIADGPSPEETLARAEGLQFPSDLIARQRREWEAAKAYYDKLGGEEIEPDPEPERGVWPAKPEAVTEMQVALSIYGETPTTLFHVAQLPTTDPTEIPAYLRLGNWNACPPPEFHVAALRRWRRDWGAVPVVCAADTMELEVERRPATREAAIALALEHYAFCNDTVDQGFGTLEALAASLMVSDWRYFWWD